MARPRRDGSPSRAPRKLKLTDRMLRGLQPEPSAYLVWDTKIAGLAVEPNMHVDLRDMNAAEAEAAVGDMIDQAQQIALQDFLLKCVGMGLTENDLERELAQQRAELDLIREQLLAKFRSFVARGGKQLH